MLRAIILILSVGLRLQGNPTPTQVPVPDCLTPVEKKQLATEEKIDKRIKIYRQISSRLHQTVETALTKKSFEEIPALLECWKDHLSASLKDVEAKVNRKKKSGALIDYEIEVRKSILDMTDARLKAPYQQQNAFDSWLEQANMVHERFVDILFQR